MAVLVTAMIRGSVAVPVCFALFLMAVAVARASEAAGDALDAELLPTLAAGVLIVSAARNPGRRPS
jgi:hypothetical protein